MLIYYQFISLNLWRLVDNLLELHRGVDLRGEKYVRKKIRTQKCLNSNKAHISVSQHVIY